MKLADPRSLLPVQGTKCHNGAQEWLEKSRTGKMLLHMDSRSACEGTLGVTKRMHPVPVYCDTGGYDTRLKALEEQGAVVVHQFKYENPSRRIRRGAMPSDLKYKDKTAYRSYDEMRQDSFLNSMSYDHWRNATSRFAEILALLGNDHRIDAQHLDSAQMTGCLVFLTSDKRDIWSKRHALEQLIGLRVFHTSTEWEQFLQHIQQ